MDIYNEVFIIFDTNNVWVFMIVFFFDTFGFIYHARIFIPRQTISSANMVQNATSSNNNSDIERLSHLNIPIKYHCLIGTTIFDTCGGRFFDIIVDVEY